MTCQGVTVGHSFRLKGAAGAANGKADVCASLPAAASLPGTREAPMLTHKGHRGRRLCWEG